MNAYFADSSAVVKRYVEEGGSVWVKGLFIAPPTNAILIAGVTSVEVVSAITRRTRSGTITSEDAEFACNSFLADLHNDYWIGLVTELLLDQAIYLARFYGLRGYDAVQLAAANDANALRLSVGLDPLIFLSADKELNTAAHAEGMTVDNPNSHS